MSTATGGRVVSGRDLRVLLGLGSAGLLLAVLVGAGYHLHPWVITAVAAAAVVVAAFPASPAPAAACVVAVFLSLSGDVGFTAWFVAVALLLHSVHVLAGLAEIIPAGARAEAMALAPAVRRWLRTQAVTIPILIIIAALLP
ncbi:MAG TPA: hypothetical protein VFY84_05220 [Jiangellales bacterium]|nr:hypothetical protein [Jiangellales bacterium]